MRRLLLEFDRREQVDSIFGWDDSADGPGVVGIGRWARKMGLNDSVKSAQSKGISESVTERTENNGIT